MIMAWAKAASDDQTTRGPVEVKTLVTLIGVAGRLIVTHARIDVVKAGISGPERTVVRKGFRTVGQDVLRA